MKKTLLIFFLLNYGYSNAQSVKTSQQKQLNQTQIDSVYLIHLIASAEVWLDTNTDSTYKYLKKSELIAQRYPKLSINFKLWDIFNSYYANVGNTERRKFYIQKAKEIADKVNKPEYKKISAFNEASYQVSKGDFSEAIKLFLSLSKNLNPNIDYERKLLLKLYNSISICYINIKKNDNAIAYAKKKLPLCRTSQDSLNYFKTLFVTKTQDINDLQEIKQIYEHGIALSIKNKSIKNEVIFNIDLGDVYIRLNDYELAEKYTIQALKLAQTNGFIDYMFSCRQNLGQIYSGKKEYTKAIQLYNETIIYCKKIDNKKLLSITHLNLSEAYKKLKNYEKAYENYVVFSRIEENLAGVEKQKIISNLETQYLINEQQKLVTNKEIQNRIQQQQLEVSKTQKIILSILLTIVGVLFSWAFINYQKKKKLSYELNKEKKLALAQANELTKLNASKDKLFAMLAHDLRSPLSELQANLFLLQSETLNAKALDSEQLSKTYNELSNIQLILDNLLEWARLQIKEDKPRFISIPINSIVSIAIKQLENASTKKEITIINTIQKEIIVMVDENQMLIVLRNILSNAVKYTPSKGYIHISTEKKLGNTIAIKVRDSGIGMSIEEVSKVFDFPKTKLGTAGEVGIGIGLGLSKELVKNNFGTLSAKSSTEKGTEICIEVKSSI